MAHLRPLATEGSTKNGYWRGGGTGDRRARLGGSMSPSHLRGTDATATVRSGKGCFVRYSRKYKYKGSPRLPVLRSFRPPTSPSFRPSLPFRSPPGPLLRGSESFDPSLIRSVQPQMALCPAPQVQHLEDVIPLARWSCHNSQVLGLLSGTSGAWEREIGMAR